MAFAYDANEFVYGADIAELQRDPSLAYNDLKPMYLLNTRSTYFAAAITGWDPVWAWECVLARNTIIDYVTTDPTPTKEWINQIEYHNLDDLRTKIIKFGNHGTHSPEGHQYRFVFDMSKYVDKTVVDSMPSGTYDFDSWETLFPGLLTTNDRDPEGTIATMNQLTWDGSPLRKSFWYDGVWRRLSHMNDFLVSRNDLLPIGTSTDYSCTTIRSYGSWIMFWNPGCWDDYNNLPGDGKEGYIHVVMKGMSGEFNEGKAINNLYIEPPPDPQPSRARAYKTFYPSRAFFLIRVRWRLFNEDHSISAVSKLVLMEFNILGHDVSDVFSSDNVEMFKSLCGVPRNPSPSAPFNPGAGGREYLIMEIVSYVIFAKMSKTAVTFRF